MSNTIDLSREIIGVEWEVQLSLPEFPHTTVLVAYGDEKHGFDLSKKFQILDYHPGYQNQNGLIKGLAWVFCNYLYMMNTFEGSLIVDIPVNNLEIRSRPTTLDLFANECLKQEMNLASFLRELNLNTSSGIGVLLPKSKYSYLVTQDSEFLNSMYGFLNPLSSTRPSKHVNISFSERLGILGDLDQNELYYSAWVNKSYSLNSFKTYILLKTHDVKFRVARLHITVPYNFVDYKDLVVYAKKIWLANNFKDLVLAYTALMDYLNDWSEEYVQLEPILVCYIKNSRVVTVSGLV